MAAGRRLVALAKVIPRRCLIAGAFPEPSIVTRYLQRRNGLENVRSVSVSIVDFAPLWCDHQAMSRCRMRLKIAAPGVQVRFGALLRAAGVARSESGAALGRRAAVPPPSSPPESGFLTRLLHSPCTRFTRPPYTDARTVILCEQQYEV